MHGMRIFFFFLPFLGWVGNYLGRVELPLVLEVIRQTPCQPSIKQKMYFFPNSWNHKNKTNKHCAHITSIWFYLKILQVLH